jgi:CHASE2 domain-containing sensor protein/signal transduction histidine kinase
MMERLARRATGGETGASGRGLVPVAPGRLYAEWLAVALVATLMVTLFVTGSFTARIDNIFYDQVLRANARPTPDDILIVAIDERSLQAIGRWPWPRRVHAQAIAHMAAARPRAIGYDVLFTEHNADDPALAAAIARTPTYLPLSIDVPGTDGAPFDAVLPTPELARAAAGIGHVNIGFDGDRVIRQISLEEGGGGRRWMQLAALMGGTRFGTDIHADDPGLWQARPVLVPYGGAAGHIRTMSFVDIHDGRVPPELLRGRYIFVGATATGLGDSYPTPTSGPTSQMAGVEIQAHLLDGLLRGIRIAPATATAQLGVALTGLWLLLVSFLWLSPRATGYLAIALVVVVLLMTALLMRFGHVWLPPTPALLGIAFVYPLWGWRRLQAISVYMVDELSALGRERDDFPQAVLPYAAPSEVTLQASLLHQSIDRLRDLRRFLSDSIGKLPDAVFVTDTMGRILLANAQAGKLAAKLGVEAGFDADLRPLLALLKRRNGTALPSPFDGEGGEGGTDIGEAGRAEVTTADGDMFDLRYVAQRDASDRHVGWLLRIVDITRLRRAERQREEALQFLSHDMRAPQSAILTMLQTSKDVPPALAARIEAQARRTLDLAEDFVQLARAEAKPVEMEEVDLCDVLIDAADIFWAQARERNVRILTQECDEPELVRGSRALLTRAVMNLISNAIKYSDAGGEVRCGLTIDGDRVRIEIADRGVGMTAEQRAGLFDRFRSGPREGVGLGLALVDTVVRRHGGTVECDSEEGVGTRFAIVLPRG